MRSVAYALRRLSEGAQEATAHPLAIAAAHATLDVLADEKLIARAAELAPVLEQAIHSLKGEPHVTDIRNIGLAAAIELAPIPGSPRA